MVVAERVGIIRNILQEVLGETVTMVRGQGSTSLVFMYKACRHEIGIDVREEYDDGGECFEYSKVLYVEGTFEDEIYGILDQIV